MKTLNLIQGSPEWLAVRANHFTASEAPAMLGVSKYVTRSELLRQKATGITEEIGAAKQRLFDAGHNAEALARPVVERIIGEELYPVTGVLEVEGLPLLASFDGITMMEDAIWENKLFNASLAESVARNELEPHYWAQLEQQLLVSGAQKAYFTTSDGTEEKTIGTWYVSVPERRAQLIAGWKQFADDLAGYQHVESAAVHAGKAPDTLPALHIEVTGMVTASNLTAFKSHALDVFSGIKTSLQSDEDFADAEKTVKWCGEVEDKLEAAKQHALSQTASIDELFRTIDDIKAEARAKRLELEKLVKSRKDSIRTEIVQDGKDKLTAHIKALNDRLGKPYMPAIAADFAGAIKGKKTMASLRDAADTELARAKASATVIADMLEANLKALLALGGQHMFLFADESVIVHKAPDDLAMLIKSRISDHQQAEQERERIRQEEATRKTPEQEPTPERVTPVSIAHIGRPAGNSAQGNPTLRLGQINERLAPIALSADGLASLGFAPAATDKSAKLYHERDFPRICAALVQHIQAVQASRPAPTAQASPTATRHTERTDDMAKTFTAPAHYDDEPYTPIPMQPVTSNQVKAIGYDEATKTLAVTFTRGAGTIYHYPDVAPELYAEFIGAESVGAFFGRHIKQLPFKKFRAPEEMAA